MLSGAFFKKNKVKKTKSGLPTLATALKMVGTFLLVALGLILFRSTSLGEAGMIISKIALNWGGLFIDYTTLINGLLCMFILFCKDFRDEFLPNKQIFSKGFLLQYRYELTVATYIILIIFFGVFDGNQFIYFKF